MTTDSTEFTCPQCGQIPREKLIILPDSANNKSEISKTEQRNPTVVPQEIIEMVDNEPENLSKLQSLIKNGLSPNEAKIIISFISGENVLSIASTFKISVSEVMDIVVPYVDVVGTDDN